MYPWVLVVCGRESLSSWIEKKKEGKRERERALEAVPLLALSICNTTTASLDHSHYICHSDCEKKTE